MATSGKSPPAWFKQLNWSTPLSAAAVSARRNVIPDFPGCYVWTLHDRRSLRPGEVIYVGEAKVSLHQRVPNYLVNWRDRPPPKSPQHKGKGFILYERERHSDHLVFVRWVEYGASPADISLLESSLIDYLEPWYNDRDESVRHGVLADWETLIPGLLRDPRRAFRKPPQP